MRFAAVLVCLALPAPAPAQPVLPGPSLIPAPTLAGPVCRPISPYWVRAGAPATGDGTRPSPYATIAAAIARGERDSACRVVVQLESGTYPEAITVTRSLELVGASTRGGVVLTAPIVNRTNAPLALRNMTLLGAPAPAVEVSGGGRTILHGVLVERATRFGVRARGGSLELSFVEIRGTVAGRADRAEGTAVFVSDGTRAVVSDSIFLGNASGGIAARGAQTRVVVRDSHVLATRHNPNFTSDTRQFVLQGGTRVVPRAPAPSKLGVPLPAPGGVSVAPPLVGGPIEQFWGLGGVNISDGATLLAERLRVDDNDLFGLVLYGGARARIRSATLSRTRAIPTPGFISGGVNLAVQGATIEADSVHAVSGPIGVGGLSGAAIQIHAGTVQDNEIGYALSGVASDLRCIVARATNNGTLFSGTSLPVPNASLDPAPAPVCPTVPWTE